MRAEALVRQEFRSIDDLVIVCRRERLATVRRIDAVLLEPGHALFAANGSRTIGTPGTVIILRSQIAVVEHSHAVHGVAFRLRDFFELLAVDMEVHAPVVKAKHLRRIIARAREDFQFGRCVTQHQVCRFGNAVVSDVRIGMHLAVGAVHAHLERHDYVGILREHRRQLLYMLQHPLVIRSHVATAIVPRVVTDAHNHVPVILADIVESLLQYVQGIFGKVLVLAANRIPARRIDA